MFKVQVQRAVPMGEIRGKDNPTEQFLGSLVAEIERQLASVETAKVETK